MTPSLFVGLKPQLLQGTVSITNFLFKPWGIISRPEEHEFNAPA